MKKHKRICQIFVVAMALSVTAQASDLAKEKRWAEQVVGDLFDGEPMMLTSADPGGELEFLSLYTEAEMPKETAVIIMHGLGIHPDWPTVVNPLRVELAAQGWPTLSIQLPILANETDGSEYAALMPEVAPRIHAAVDALKASDAKNVVLLAHSMGARMTAYALAEDSSLAEKVVAFAAIGMSEGNEENLEQISLPMLDLYGGEDNEGVLASVETRKAAQAHNAAYRQQRIPDADHFFDGYEEPLVEAVAEWLGRL